MLKIGDFSKLTRVSIRMLRHYDEIGVLKPMNVDDSTGYRFYSADQISLLNRILVLKEMGFSLAEICGLMEKEFDNKQLVSLLENRKRQISEAIDKENEKLLRVENLIQFINKENEFMKYEVVLKDIPAYKVISLRSIIPTYQAEGALWDELCMYMEKNSIKGNEPSYAIYYDDGYKESDVDVEITMCITENIVESDRVKMRNLEAVSEAATVIHKGPFDEVASAYHSLGVWLDANGYEICAPCRAIYHKGPWCEENPENFITEIQAPVVKKR